MTDSSEWQHLAALSPEERLRDPIYYQLPAAWERALREGDLPTLRQLWTLGTPELLVAGVEEVARGTGSMEVVQWLEEVGGSTTELWDQAWVAALRGGHLPLANWLWEGWARIGETGSTTDYRAWSPPYPEGPWRAACRSGDLEVLQWLRERPGDYLAPLSCEQLWRGAIRCDLSVFRWLESWAPLPEWKWWSTWSHPDPEVIRWVWGYHQRPIHRRLSYEWRRNLGRCGDRELFEAFWESRSDDPDELAAAWEGLCLAGHLQLAEQLLEAGYLVTSQCWSDAWWGVCAQGEVRVAEWLRERAPSAFTETLEGWANACLEGNQVIAQWLACQGTLTEKDLDEGWRYGCSGGHLQLLRWLWEVETPPPSDSRHRRWVKVLLGWAPYRPCLYSWLEGLIEEDPSRLDPTDQNWERAVGKGWVSVAQTIYSRRPEVAESSPLRRQWRRAVRSGSLPLAQWLWTLGPIDPGYHDSQARHHAYRSRSLPMVQWVWSLQGAEHQTHHESGWLFACTEANLRMARWFIRQGGVDVTRHRSRGWRRAIHSLELMVWMGQLPGVDIHLDDEYAWRHVCANGDSRQARWLWACGGVDLHARHESAWRRACIGGHRPLAQWIASLGEVDHLILGVWVWRAVVRTLCPDHPVVEYLLSLGIPIPLLERTYRHYSEMRPVLDRWLAERRLKSARG